MFYSCRPGRRALSPAPPLSLLYLALDPSKIKTEARGGRAQLERINGRVHGPSDPYHRRGDDTRLLGGPDSLLPPFTPRLCKFDAVVIGSVASVEISISRRLSGDRREKARKRSAALTNRVRHLRLFLSLFVCPVFPDGAALFISELHVIITVTS